MNETYSYWKHTDTENVGDTQLLNTDKYWKHRTTDNTFTEKYKITENTQVLKTLIILIYIYIYLQLLENTHLKMHLLKNVHNYWAQTYWKHTTTDNLYHSKHTSKNVTPESTRCTENIQLLKNTQSLRTHKNWKHTRIISDKLHHLKKTW